MFAAAGGDEEKAATTATPTATSTAAESRTSTPTPTSTPEVVVLRAGTVRELDYTEGDLVRFRVENDAPGEVHVHGYDLKEEVGPNKPADFSFPATITGIFEVELEGTSQQVAELKVEPR